MRKSFAELRLLLSKDAITPFDTVHSTARGAIGRQAIENDPSWLPLTICIDRDLTADAIIPISLFVIEEVEALPGWLPYSWTVLRHCMLRPRKHGQAVVLSV